MKRTEDKNKFNEEHYDRIHLAVPKGMKEIIKNLASGKGISLNAYFLDLVHLDQEGMFDKFKISEKNKKQIRSDYYKEPKHKVMTLSSKMAIKFIAEPSWKSEKQ